MSIRVYSSMQKPLVLEGDHIYNAEATNGKKLQFIFENDFLNKIFLEDNGERISLKSHNIPKTLFGKSISWVKSGDFYYTISYQDNGDVRLCAHHRMRGGMIQPDQVVPHLRRREGWVQVCNAIDRDLALIPGERYSSLAANIIVGFSTVIAGGGGAIIGGLIGAFFSPIGIAIGAGIGAGIGGAVGGGIGYSASSSHVEEQNRMAARIKSDVERILALFIETSTHAENRDRVECTRTTRELINSLSQERRYISLSEYDFDFNEGQFRKMTNFVEDSQRNTVVTCLKFIICCAVALLPHTDDDGMSRPTDALLRNLGRLADTLQSAQKNRAYLTLGRVYLEKGDITAASRYLRMIDRESDVFCIAQRFIQVLSDYQQPVY